MALWCIFYGDINRYQYLFKKGVFKEGHNVAMGTQKIVPPLNNALVRPCLAYCKRSKNILKKKFEFFSLKQPGHAHQLAK